MEAVQPRTKMPLARDTSRRVLVWIALALCTALVVAWLVAHFARSDPGDAPAFAPGWLTLAAAVLSAAGLIPLSARPRLLRVQRGLAWAGLLLMLWAANGLPFDLLRIVRLIPLPVDWFGLAIRTLALAAVVVLARLLLLRPPAPAFTPVSPTRGVSWYGYAACVLALPYPLLRTVWMLGGTLGLTRAGAGGEGFAPWLLAIPWLLAAALSLLLARPRPRLPRRLLLAAGWTATTIVAMIGPAAFWTLIRALVSGQGLGLVDMDAWVPTLFYTSWFLWAIAAAAATRSYQLRTASV